MRTLFLSALLLLAPASHRPDELKRERLPADVDFVVHVDIDGLKQTELWRHATTVGEAHFDMDELEEFDEIKARYGIDPLTDFRAVTLFKVKTEEEPTVVLFSTSGNIDQALVVLQKEPGYARVVEEGVELHTWKDGFESDSEVSFAYVHALSTGERVIALSSNRSSALRSAHVLRGEQPNHAQGGSLLTIAPARGSFLYMAAASVPHLDEFTPASQVFGLAQGIQVDLGEAGGFLNAHMGVTTKSPDDALNITNVIQGLVSLARLAGSEMAELVELLGGLRFDTRGSEVWVDFQFGVQRLIQIMEALDDDDDDGDETIETK